MKKGFTLIEIIVCIIILSIIGVSSFVGIKTIVKNIRIDKLEQITDRALQAAEVYIENNREMKNELFNKKNTVIVPLNVLMNEGLLDLKGTTLEKNEVEDEYIVATFMKNGGSGENCIDLTEQPSWNLSSDNSFSICTNESGTSNSIIIGGTTSNKDYTEGTRKYFVDSANNYVTFNNKIYRLMYIDKDDSLVIYTPEDTFGDDFNGKTQPIKGELTTNIKKLTHYGLYTYVSDGSSSNYQDKKYNMENNPTIATFGDFSQNGYVNIHSNFSEYGYSTCPYETTAYDCYKFKTDSSHYVTHDTYYAYSKFTSSFALQKDINASNNEQIVGYSDFEQNSSLFSYVYVENIYDAVVGYDRYKNITDYEEIYITKGRKLQLRSCMKLVEGLGSDVNPYKIKDMC